VREEGTAEALPGPKGWSGIKGRRTGFFRTQEHDGVWWFITPGGDGFYVLGTDHVNWNGHPCEKLGYAPYNRNLMNKYGEIDEWVQLAVSRLLSWGFNTLGWGHSKEMRHRGLVHTEHMEFGTSFAKAESISAPATWTGFPDVFSRKFSDHCDRMAKKSCEPNRDDPWLLGYFTDNELEWFGKSRRDTGLFEEAIRKEPASPAKKRLAHLLKLRYPSLKDLNRAWGTKLEGFEDILDMEEPPPLNRCVEGDAEAFVRLVAEEYFSTVTDAIRRYDPNHLILGCRFGSDAPPSVWEVAGRYCDVVTVNCYRTIDLARGVLSDGFEEDLKKWYGLAGRPLMITEWSFPALDAGLPCKHGAGQRVATQKDRAKAFTIFQRLLFSTPFVVGSDYFMWVDEPALGISSSFPEDSNYGLVNEEDEPYPELTSAASELNPKVYAIHSAGGYRS